MKWKWIVLRKPTNPRTNIHLRRRAPPDENRPRIWLEDSSQHTNHRALPSAIWAKQPNNPALRQVERNIAQGDP